MVCRGRADKGNWKIKIGRDEITSTGLNLHSLQTQVRGRVRGDLIEVCKWMKRLNEGDAIKVLVVKEESRTRGKCAS